MNWLTASISRLTVKNADMPLPFFRAFFGTFSPLNW
jgi:hypothetical protein